MKKLLFLCITLIAVICLQAMKTESAMENTAKAKELEISFNYERKPGTGSNQYAVWIENENNEVIKTLFVTSFTTKGRVRENQPTGPGYTFRPACVPTWVKNAKVSEMSAEEVDAFTGATPASGEKKFTWDFTDASGKAISKGNYKVCVEATLKNECRIIFTGSFSTDTSTGEIPVKVLETGHDDTYTGMIQKVKFKLK